MDYAALDNAALWALAVGFFSPPAIALIQQTRWSPRRQALVAFAFYLVVAAGTAWVSGLFNVADYARLALLIFVSGATSYTALWKPTGVAPAIAQATSPHHTEGALE
jgi:hypothetical protein